MEDNYDNKMMEPKKDKKGEYDTKERTLVQIGDKMRSWTKKQIADFNDGKKSFKEIDKEDDFDQATGYPAWDKDE